MAKAQPDKKCVFMLVETTEPPSKIVQDMKLLRLNQALPIKLFFGNWDDDPREIYDIPEVTTWCQNFIRLGGLSFIDGVLEMTSTELLHTPSQLMVMACSGWPGAERVGAQTFKYDLDRIEATERQYRPKGFA